MTATGSVASAHAICGFLFTSATADLGRVGRGARLDARSAAAHRWVWLCFGVRSGRASWRGVAQDRRARLEEALPSSPCPVTGRGREAVEWVGSSSGWIRTSCRRASRCSTTGNGCSAVAGSAPTGPAIGSCWQSGGGGRNGSGRSRAATASAGTSPTLPPRIDTERSQKRMSPTGGAAPARGARWLRTIATERRRPLFE